MSEHLLSCYTHWAPSPLPHTLVGFLIIIYCLFYHPDDKETKIGKTLLQQRKSFPAKSCAHI